MANDKKQPDIYFGFNKPAVDVRGGGSTRVEQTFTGVYQPVEQPTRQLSQPERERLAAAVIEWLRNRK